MMAGQLPLCVQRAGVHAAGRRLHARRADASCTSTRSSSASAPSAESCEHSPLRAPLKLVPLCVTPKYLSEISRLVSGYSASYWIARYTALDISRQLRDRSLSIEAVADLFHFSSLSHFSRYVQWYAVG